MMNTSSAPDKLSKIEKATQKYMIKSIMIQITVCIMCATAFLLYTRTMINGV